MKKNFPQFFQQIKNYASSDHLIIFSFIFFQFEKILNWHDCPQNWIIGFKFAKVSQKKKIYKKFQDFLWKNW